MDALTTTIKLIVSVAIALLAFPGFSRAESKTIELPRLIETFMVKPNSNPAWSMGAGKGTPQIRWTSSGVESRPDCGSYNSCRRGVTRVLLNGKEMQHLRQRLEPVPWDLFMASKSQARFGPEVISISPFCDTVECSFDFKNAMRVEGFSLKRICKAGPATFRHTGYEVRKGASHVYTVVSDSTGSGGTSTSLSLFFKAPPIPADLCSEVENND